MTKVGVVSFHRNYNFGAALQCAALCQAIKTLGGTPVVVDFAPYEAPPSLFTRWGVRTRGWKGAFTKKFYDTIHGGRAQKAFSNFRNSNWSSTPPCVTSADIDKHTKEIDIFVSGSDQVFRLDRPSPYFLEWGSERKLRKISYAACCTSPDQPPFSQELLSKWLDDFSYLSVRDDFSREVIRGVVNKKVEVVADPTFLVDHLEKEETTEKIAEDYILVYLLGEEISGGMKTLLSRARKVHPRSKVLAICSTYLRPPAFPWADKVIHGIGPAEWVEYIRSSRLVITDSFHGIIFATKFRRPLVGYYREKIRAPRLVDLAERYDLEDRLFSHSEKVPMDVLENSSSEKTRDLINLDRKKSMKFLELALGNLQS